MYEATKDRGGISRYNGQETISVSIQKQQDSTDMEVSSAVKEKIEELMADDSDLTITVANDTSDTILDSLKRRSRDNGSGGYYLHAHHFPVLWRL